MVTKRATTCAKCYLRIAPYEVCTLYRKTEYHQHCFLKLVREEADEAAKMVKLSVQVKNRDKSVLSSAR